MMKLTLSDPTAASEAGEWCNSMFGEEGWDLWAQDLFSNHPKYKFEFFNEKDALLFKLRWSEYV